MRILNTNTRPATKALTKEDFLGVALEIEGWSFVPQTLILSEISFTMALDRDEDSEFLEWLDGIAQPTKEG